MRTSEASVGESPIDRRELRAWLSGISGLAPAMAGLLGGVVMGAYVMIATWSEGGNPLEPLRIIGAEHPDQNPIVAGILMHIVTAAFWGTQLGNLLANAPARMLGPRAVVPLGAAWGTVLWLLMGQVIGPLFSHRLAEADPVHYFVGHLLYGLVSVSALASMRRRQIGRG